MKVKYWSVLVLLTAVALVFSVTALASMIIPANDHAKDNPNVPDSSPVKEGLERIDFIHYAKPAYPGKAPKADTCYKLLGVKWKTLPVSYVVNPTNSGLDEGFVTAAISTSAETWDDSTSTELLSNSYGISYNAEYGVQDYRNAIAFGSYPNPGVIAVTSIWYTPVGRQIVEFDILFNTAYTWGNATSYLNLMDLQNIATHELGHGIGLDDIYSDKCSAVTMYGYSWNGDTQKRTLEPPDVTGLQKMYGA